MPDESVATGLPWRPCITHTSAVSAPIVALAALLCAVSDISAEPPPAPAQGSAKTRVVGLALNSPVRTARPSTVVLARSPGPVEGFALAPAPIPPAALTGTRSATSRGFGLDLAGPPQPLDDAQPPDGEETSTTRSTSGADDVNGVSEPQGPGHGAPTDDTTDSEELSAMVDADEPLEPLEPLAEPARPPSPRPPRIDGPFMIGHVAVASQFSRIGSIDDARPGVGPLGRLELGQVVLPWLTMGVEVSFGAGFTSSSRSLHGGLMAQFGFIPIRDAGLALRVATGFGAGTIRQDGVEQRAGFGGALMGSGVRYWFFPGGERRRPTRAGGFAIAPEFAWQGYLPSRSGGPMSHVVTLGLAAAIFFGD